jgi:uncharacterized membrane protein YdjX (TVP38/TMEM64 family)
MEWLAPIVLRFSSFGAWGPILFIAAYVIGALTLAPVFVLTFAAGALFGLWRGTLFVFIGAILGASAVYLVAATLARDRVLAWADRDPRVAAVRKAVVGRGVWIMFLLRLSPLMPFNLLNYALSLSGVRYRDYAVATIGMLPAIVMYVYYGKIVGDVAVIAAGVSPPRGPEYYALLLSGLAATIIATTAITRAARRAIEAERQTRISGQ